MSAERLGPRWLRRLARLTGEDVIRAWGRGGYVHDFVTAEHRHGWYDMKTGAWALEPDAAQLHYTSCRELFGGAA